MEDSMKTGDEEFDALVEFVESKEDADLNRILPKKVSISTLRRWFREAVDHAADWRSEAREDYEFVSGKQWTDADRAKLEETGRPALVINRIKPLINVLSGYQRLNRQDIDFLPRTNDDTNICTVRKGITKYVMDTCDYDTHESDVFMDASICGIGVFSVGYDQDEETGDGEAYIRREDPFGVYFDPEARKPDFSDGKFIFRAKWVDKDELKEAFPQHSAEIEAQCDVYDNEEKRGNDWTEPLWYQSDLKKARLVECWYKQRERLEVAILRDGREVSRNEVTAEMLLMGEVVGSRSFVATRVHVAVFMDRILLSDEYSPYEHGEFPFVPLVCYHYGVGDLPAGFVRDLKDPQREINKRRIQALHILNTMGNGGGYVEEDAMSPDQFDDFERNNNIPGHYTKVRPGSLSNGKIQERGVANPPMALTQAEIQATEDLRAISGINESLMGTDIASQQSGRAIELRQKQAITHIAPMFDQLRKAKKRIAMLLWGRRGHKGIIPQFYTEEKVYRVEGENGQQFITINQQVVQQDPLGNVIHTTLNQLDHGEFDIVVADTAASTTMRQAQMWNLVDSVSKLGVPGELVFDIILDLSDTPNKALIKQRWQERQQQQAQAVQANNQFQKELAQIKTHKHQTNITYKDAPLPIQLAMAAQEGLCDWQFAQYVTKLYLENQLPELADQMQAQAQQQQAMAQMQAQGRQLPPALATRGVTPKRFDSDTTVNNMRAGQSPAAM